VRGWLLVVIWMMGYNVFLLRIKIVKDYEWGLY
jgi:hypothetical protein